MSKSLASVFSTGSDVTVPKERVPLGKGALASDYYPAKIEYAYLTESKNGAVGVVLSLKVLVNDTEVVKGETLWITNRDKENFYKDRDGKKVVMPSFQTLSDIYGLLTGNPVDALQDDIEERVIKVYDYTAKAEVPTQVDMITSLIGAPIGVLIQKVMKNKTAQKQDGSYADTAEFYETNQFAKFIDAETGRTLTEAIADQNEPTFKLAWLKQNEGVTRDLRTIKEAGTTPATTPSTSNATNSTAGTTPKKSLFSR